MFAACSSDRSSDGRAATRKACAPWIISHHLNLPRAQVLAERAFATLQRFLHVEAVGGVVLLIAAAVALIWANSPFAHSYHDLWHLPLSIGLGEFAFSRSLHFWINDALMTVFFLVVGMEIRREIHEGDTEQARSGDFCLSSRPPEGSSSPP